MIKRIVFYLQRMFLGSYRLAVKSGLKCGVGISVMGNVNFGSEPYLITLHDEVRLSSGVTFVTHDGGTWAFRDIEKYTKVIKYGCIEIGSRTFLGCNCIIMPGVKIGERCVIGAGSVVTHNIPDNSVVVGNPGTVIMTTNEYAEKCLSNLKTYNEDEYCSNKREFLEKYCR